VGALGGQPPSSTRKVSKQGKGFEKLRFRSTFDIIEAAEKGLLPDKIMINVHPQRWRDNPVEWMKKLVWQNAKNVVKRAILIRRLRRLHRLIVSRKSAKAQRDSGRLSVVRRENREKELAADERRCNRIGDVRTLSLY
jgi:hypothetical protein